MSVRTRGHEAVRRIGEQGRLYSPASILFVAIVGLWEVWVRWADIPAVILPTPSRILEALLTHWDVLLHGGLVTAATALGGLLGGILVGSPIAYLTARSRSVAAFVLPYVVTLRIAPLVAIAPLVFLWIGEGVGARILLVTTMTVFPVVIASDDGLRAVPNEYLDLVESVGAPGTSTFLRVELPAAAPSIFAGLKLAAALSVVGAVVAEFVTLESGLGFRIFEASTYLETPLMFAALLALAVLGVAFYGVPALIERRSRWT